MKITLLSFLASCAIATAQTYNPYVCSPSESNVGFYDRINATVDHVAAQAALDAIAISSQGQLNSAAFHDSYDHVWTGTIQHDDYPDRPSR
jgi:hypothetical protein